MSRTRPIVAAVLTLGCLGAPLFSTAPAAAAPTTISAPPSANPVVRADTSYGARGVWVPKGSRAVLRFSGQRGDIVTVDEGGRERMRLFRKDRELRPTWEGSALYRLPRDGTYRFNVTVDNFDNRRVTLAKARVHDLDIDGPAVRTPKARPGYIDLAAVRLRGDDRVTVDTGREEQRVYSPNGSYEIGYGDFLMLRPGHDMRVDNDGSAVGGRIQRGLNLVRVRSGHRVTAASALLTPATPDGASVVVAPDRKVARELVFTFDAAAGDLMYFDELDGPGVTGLWSFVDRWTGPVTSLVSEPVDAAESLVMASTGPHEISTVITEIGGATTSTVRLRKAVRVGDLVPDGPAVDITFDGSGTRVYSLATDTGQRLETTTTDLGVGEGWTIVMGPRSPWWCGQEPGGPLGCADNFTGRVSDTEPVFNSPYLYVRQPVAVAYPSVGTTGTVSLRLLSKATAG